MYQTRRPFAAGTQRSLNNTSSFRRRRLGIEPGDLMHQDFKEDRLTPKVPGEVV